MKPVLLCTEQFIADYGQRLSTVAPDINVVSVGASGDVSSEDLARITIAFMSKDTWPKLAKPFMDAVEAAPSIDWFHIFSAGTEGPIFDRLRERGVRVSRSAGASANAIAESVFMLLHGLTRNVREIVHAQAEHRFEWHEWSELEGRKIAVVGYGPIGQRVAHLALAYGMRPTIVRQRVRGDEPHPTRTVAEIADIAAEHDVLVIALPINDDTRGIISQSVIARMPANALLINIARGGLVDQAALTEALAAGRIGGAALDVFDIEPLPADDPLWDLPNVVITPHNAGSSYGGPKAVVEIFFANLALYLAGEKMRYEV